MNGGHLAGVRLFSPIEVLSSDRWWPGSFIRLYDSPRGLLVLYRLHETGTVCSALAGDVRKVDR